MKFGLSVLIFGREDVIPFLPLLADNGITNIELRGYPPRIPYDDKEYVKRLCTAIKKNSMIIHSFHLPFNSMNIASDDIEIRKRSVKEVINGINLCETIGGNFAVLHAGAKYENKQKFEECSFESIMEIFNECKKRGIKLALENMLPGRVGEDFNFFERTFKKLNSDNVGLCFDSSHANVNGTIYEFLEKSKDKLFTVHFSDNYGKSDDHLFPFEGNIDWARIIKILNRISYNSIFMLEVAAIDGLSPQEHLDIYKKCIEKLDDMAKKENKLCPEQN